MSDATPPHDGEQTVTLSALIRRLAEGPAERVRFEDLLAGFGARAFGAVLFIFAVPNLLPLPPGSSTVLGLPLLLIAPQLAFGRANPWLPRRLLDKTINRSVLAAISRRLGPSLARIERLSTRRLAFLFGRAGDLALGAVCTLLAAVLILPIPLGNLLPATAVAILGLSLVQRDGALALLGYLAAAVSLAVLAMGGHLVVAAARQLLGWIGA
jgi:hypothetical protein